MTIFLFTILVILYLINRKQINWWINFNFPLTDKLFKITFITLLSLYIAYILISTPSNPQELVHTALWSFVLVGTIFVGISLFILLPFLIYEYIKNLKNKSK